VSSTSSLLQIQTSESFQKNCPRITEHNNDPTKINYELRKSYGNTFGEAL